MSTGESSLPSQRLLGKVALVTSGATGIGESTVRLFHRHGAKVLIVDIKDDLGHQLCSSLNSGARYLHCDVTVEDDVARAVDHAVETFGALDIMVNNAGVAGRPVPDIRDFAFSEFRDVFDVNVNGVFLGAKHAARAMVPRGKGSIVSLTSVSGVLGGLGPHAYTASKHAVVGLTKSVAADMGKHGVRVNCVSPYAVPTSLALPHLPEGEGGDGVLKWFWEFTGGGANLKGVDLEAADVAEDKEACNLKSQAYNMCSCSHFFMSDYCPWVKDCLFSKDVIAAPLLPVYHQSASKEFKYSTLTEC